MGSKHKACVFCVDARDERVIDVNGAVYATLDKYPVTTGHCLIIPFRHVADWFGMSEDERRNAYQLASAMAQEIRQEDKSVVGFNVGYNCGIAAGQTVMHAHMHLIPRRLGDVKNPRGGIRGVIPEKRDY